MLTASAASCADVSKRLLRKHFVFLIEMHLWFLNSKDASPAGHPPRVVLHLLVRRARRPTTLLRHCRIWQFLIVVSPRLQVTGDRFDGVK
jgi:hypothetical protein